MIQPLEEGCTNWETTTYIGVGEDSNKRLDAKGSQVDGKIVNSQVGVPKEPQEMYPRILQVCGRCLRYGDPRLDI